MRSTRHDIRTLKRLLAGDPSIRRQVFGDLADAPPETVDRERARVVGEGWGKRLLRLQDPEGRWADGRAVCTAVRCDDITLLILQIPLEPDTASGTGPTGPNGSSGPRRAHQKVRDTCGPRACSSLKRLEVHLFASRC
jgi:hypothetical protein